MMKFVKSQMKSVMNFVNVLEIKVFNRATKLDHFTKTKVVPENLSIRNSEFVFKIVKV